MLTGAALQTALSLSAAPVNALGEIRTVISTTNTTAEAINLIEAAGARLDAWQFEFGGAALAANEIYAWVPAHLADELASLSVITSLALPINGLSDAGAVTTAGDSLLLASNARAALGFNGAGVKVGVISTGVPGLSGAQSTGDLPPSITVDPVRSGRLTHDEGTGMLEIVHDLAPGAQLYFSGFRHVGYDGLGNEIAEFTTTDMVNAINWLVSQGVDIIVDDIQFFNEPAFDDGIVADAAATAVSQGVTFVTAGGNRANGHYQGQFSNNGFGFQDFKVGTGFDDILNVAVNPNSTVNAWLQWSDPIGTSSNNYDISFIDLNTGALIGTRGTDVQNGVGGDDFPLERARWTNTSGLAVQVGVVVQRVSGVDRELEIYIDPNGVAADDDATITDSMFGHKAVESVITAGAIDAADPGTDTIEAYSSRGPATIYTDFTNQTKTARPALDGIGIDGGNTTSFGTDIPGDPDAFPNFFGTSAAAPHVAGIAALVLSANPLLTPAQVASILSTTAIDILAAGYDGDSGSGRFNALGAVYKAFIPNSPFLHGLSDSGLNPLDGVTNDTTPTFWGAVPANSFVRLFVDGVERGVQQLSGGNTTFEITSNAPLPDGQRNVRILVAENSSTPLANMSFESGALTITIDTTPPPAPTVPDLHHLWDSGVSNSDNITRLSGLYFTGTGPLDMYITLLETTSGENQVGQFYTGSVSNNWSISTTGALADGIHHFVARATDSAGNIATSLPIAVLIDSVAPAAPSIPSLLAADDTGGVDDVTRLTSLRFSGAAVPNISVSLLSGSTPVGSGTSNGSGTWQVTSTALANGAHNISAVATDVAGNSSNSTPRSVTVDTVAAKVTNVTISGSASTHAAFAFNNPSDDTTDFDGSGIQLRTVPVGGADTVSITFSEHVANVAAGSLTLTGLAFATTQQVASGGFSYDSATFKATWRFNGPLPADQYLISLSDAVSDVAANAIDGE